MALSSERPTAEELEYALKVLQRDSSPFRSVCSDGAIHVRILQCLEAREVDPSAKDRGELTPPPKNPKIRGAFWMSSSAEHDVPVRTVFSGGKYHDLDLPAGRIFGTRAAINGMIVDQNHDVRGTGEPAPVLQHTPPAFGIYAREAVRLLALPHLMHLKAKAKLDAIAVDQILADAIQVPEAPLDQLEQWCMDQSFKASVNAQSYTLPIELPLLTGEEVQALSSKRVEQEGESTIVRIEEGTLFFAELPQAADVIHSVYGSIPPDRDDERLLHVQHIATPAFANGARSWLPCFPEQAFRYYRVKDHAYCVNFERVRDPKLQGSTSAPEDLPNEIRGISIPISDANRLVLGGFALNVEAQRIVATVEALLRRGH